MKRDLRTLPMASATLALALAAGWLQADDSRGPATTPKPIPATRVEVKEAVDRLKHRAPRLPLPEATAEERVGREGRGVANNGRMRALYLPAELRAGGFSTGQDPNLVFDYAFSTELFWIVSRVNNCHYCLGHQENKLLSAGLLDDDIAALDGDWKQFSPERKAAFAFTRKLTFAPHEIGDEDLSLLLQHYSPREALEIILLVSRYNSTNRWTDSLGIPLEGHREFVTPTSAAFQSSVTRVAPLEQSERPPLPGLAEWREEIAARSAREPRIPLVGEAETRRWLEWSEQGVPPPHARLLAHFPIAGRTWVANLAAAQDKGSLDQQLRARIAWIAAREDHAWYAQDVAWRRLRQLGLTDEEIFAGENDDGLDAATASVVRLARRLTVTPQTIVDADIAAVREHFSPEETAEIVYHVTLAAFFNRLTEAAGLPWAAE